MMIKLIGRKRITFLLFLLAANVVVAGVYFSTMTPLLSEAQAQLAAVNGEVDELQNKIAAIKQDVAYVNENMPKYKALQDKGFFLNQDRFMISRMLEDLRVRTGIASFSFSIADVEEIPNADADAIGYKLINSRIKIEKIMSPVDRNIYILLQDLSKSFPDFARIQSMDVARAGEVTEAALKDIREGKMVSFVNANAVFDWITMVPKETAPPEETSSGGAPAEFRGQ